ncbi:hypothetical protein FEI15_06965 [Lacticaseibacillus zeae]|uniref:Uncharacterized protein n=1 Tax=Lacticaseibacillus zeae TaxID=57037 RepID=A0A5R8LQZ4_LACZE|nr:hypothetical protein [Lacticaseibacillus zeae]TLF39686.1 hypothetical protein FEI15_06965 [Lacticaseibacillus zeae]
MDDFWELNPISERKLRDNNWILLTGKQVPIVVDEETHNYFITHNFEHLKKNINFLDAIKDAGFLKSKSQKVPNLISENQSKLWVTMRFFALCLGALSLLFVFYTTLTLGVPTGDKLISQSLNPLLNVSFIIIFSVLTTLIHEMAHLFFGQQTLHRRSVLINSKLAVIRVSLSHTWTWTLLGRLTAVSAGVITDLLILAILSGLNLVSHSWFLPIACAILWIRILWQFRLHKRTDGQLLLALIFDMPFLCQDLKSSKARYLIFIKFFGVSISLLLIIGWIVPLCIRIYQLFY